MSERVAEVTILLCEVAVEIYLAIQRIRFVRWRREYEVSIDRVFIASIPGCEREPVGIGLAQRLERSLVRDYGMFDRREAPQYYPEIKRPNS